MPNRRHFLQLAASTLTTVGLSHLHLQQHSRRYGQALAQPTRHKRALLIGVNDYSTQRLRSLKGCITDTQLQKELLIHRFGFTEHDILILNDADATRQNIFEAFDDHLGICEPGDVAIVHFSGHGRRVQDDGGTLVSRNSEERDPENSTIVPYQDTDSDDIPDIMGKTLFLLISKLRTENVTLVLDSCYAEGGIRGNRRVRSATRTGSSLRQASQAELEFQEQLREELGISAEDLQDRRDISIAKGIALPAARRNQEAVDATFGTDDNRFYAGAFTYFLTQYLWHEVEPVRQVIDNVSRHLTSERFTQHPSVCIAPLDCAAPPSGESPSTYFVDALDIDTIPAAEAVLQSVNGSRGTMWLGGSDPRSLDTYGVGSRFVAIASDGTPIQEDIEVRSRQGLYAEVDLPADLPEGTFLQEASRVIPSDYKLRVGIDPSLMPEWDIIQSVLGEIQRLEWLPYSSSSELYGTEVHYILTRMTADYQTWFASRSTDDQTDTISLPDPLPREQSLMIVTPGLEEIIPDSWGDANETIQQGRDRLFSKLNALAAARLIKLLINAQSSYLDVIAEIQVTGGTRRYGQFFTVRGSQHSEIESPNDILNIPVGHSIQFEIIHQEPEPLSVLVIILEETGRVFPVFPSQFFEGREENVLIAPNTPILIPSSFSPEPLTIQSSGLAEVLILASNTQMLYAMQAFLADRVRSTDIINALLTDLHGASLGTRGSERPDISIETTKIAAILIPFRAVAD